MDSVVKKNLKTSNANAGNDNSVFVLIGVALILFVAIYFLVDSFDFSHKMILEQTVDGGQELNKEVITEVEIEKSVLQLSDTEQDDIFDEKSVDFEEPSDNIGKVEISRKDDGVLIVINDYIESQRSMEENLERNTAESESRVLVSEDDRYNLGQDIHVEIDKEDISADTVDIMKQNLGPAQDNDIAKELLEVEPIVSAGDTHLKLAEEVKKR